LSKKSLINNFLDSGYLLSPDILENFGDDFDDKKFIKNLNGAVSKDKPLVLNNDLFGFLKDSKKLININWSEFEKSRALLEKGKNGKIYSTFLDLVDEKKKFIIEGVLDEVQKDDLEVVGEESDAGDSLIVLNSYSLDSRRWEVGDFVSHYKNKYNGLKDILLGRPELQGVLSINKILNKNAKEKVAIIGLVSEKSITMNGNVMLTVEDLTGKIKVLVNKDKLELYSVAKNLVLDEVIGVVGVSGNKIVFANDLLFPDVPLTKEFKKAKDEAYVAFISDTHVGSRLFLEKDFLKFIDWVNGKSGSKEQRDISSKLKYIIFAGDLVDGVGIYPGQDGELAIKEIKEQYNKIASLLGLIRKDVKIVLSPGNHDALRLSEPQPPLNKEFAGALYELPNVVFVSNPALINIHSSIDFPGFDVLVYHGASFHYFIDHVDNLRLNAAVDNPHIVSKFLLQKRHLAPSHGSSLYVPNLDDDPLIIRKIPDFFVCGEIHRSDVGEYRNITLINCSCWQSKTSYQEKVGNHPDPSKVLVANLKTREVKVLNFSS